MEISDLPPRGPIEASTTSTCFSSVTRPDAELCGAKRRIHFFMNVEVYSCTSMTYVSVGPHDFELWRRTKVSFGWYLSDRIFQVTILSLSIIDLILLFHISWILVYIPSSLFGFSFHVLEQLLNTKHNDICNPSLPTHGIFISRTW